MLPCVQCAAALAESGIFRSLPAGMHYFVPKSGLSAVLQVSQFDPEEAYVALIVFGKVQIATITIFFSL